MSLLLVLGMVNNRDLKIAVYELRQTTNLKKFLSNKIKIINCELFNQNHLLKEYNATLRHFVCLRKRHH